MSQPLRLDLQQRQGVLSRSVGTSVGLFSSLIRLRYQLSDSLGHRRWPITLGIPRPATFANKFQNCVCPPSSGMHPARRMISILYWSRWRPQQDPLRDGPAPLNSSNVYDRRIELDRRVLAKRLVLIARVE